MEFIVKIVLGVAALVAFWYLVKGMVWIIDILSDNSTTKEKSND